MAKLKLPKGLGRGALDIAGDAIEGAGSAIGGIASGIGSAVGGIAQGAGAALGGALQGALTDPDVVINNFGMAGSAGKSKIKTTVTMNFNPGNVEKLEYSEQMPLEKLMVVAIKYLQGISKSVKNQGEQEAKLSRKQALLDKESLIENASPVEQLDSMSGPGKKDKSSNISGLLKGLGAGAAILAASTLDMSDLEKLGENLKQFQDKYGWLVDIAVYRSIGAYLLKIPGLGKLVWNIVKSGGIAAAEAVVKGATFLGASGIVSVAGAVGAVGAGVYAINKWTNAEGQKSVSFADELKTRYGMNVNQEQTSVGMVTKSISIGGKSYAPGELPSEYQEIYNSYSGVRGAASKEDVDKKHAGLRAKGQTITDLQTAVYNAFRNAGFSHQGALSLAAEVGRENSFRENIIFGTHIDPKNGAVNAGIFSYQKDRATALMNMLQGQGLIQGGKIERSQKSLNAMANFARQEMDKRGDKAPNGQPLSQYLSGEKVNAEDAAAGLGKGYIAWAYNDPKYASGHKNRREAYASTAAKVGGGGDMSGQGEYASPGGGAMEAAGALVAESFDAVINAVKKIGSTDTTFKTNLTASTPKFNKTDKLIEDSVKFQAEIDLGKKEDTKKNQAIRGNTSTALRRMNEGVLDVIDPNYKMDKNSILTSYIMSFKESIA